MKKHIKLNFVDFWEGFNNNNNYFINLLQGNGYTVELTEQPDFLIYSVFGTEHEKYNCIRIFYTGENVRPNFNECDFAFSFDYLNNLRNYRLPLYTLTIDEPRVLIKNNIDVDKIIQEKTKFCNFVYSNSIPQKRTEFFYKLSQYKKVDSGGRYLNNIGAPVVDKLNFIKEYKFTIAFENSSYPGYTTEKLVQPMMVFSLPIYWGNDCIELDFNTKSFLNYYDFPNEDALIHQIIKIDLNDDLYREYLLQPYYHNNQINRFTDPKNVLDQFEKVFNTKLYPRLDQTITDSSLSPIKLSKLWDKLIKNKQNL